MPERYAPKTEKCVDCHKIFDGNTTAKRCNECRGIHYETIGRASGETTRKAKTLFPKNERACWFCNTKESVQIHHVDFDKFNQEDYNLLPICVSCHRKMHGRIQRPVLRRFFNILLKERFTYEAIADMFGTTRQNVHGIVNKPLRNKAQKLSTDNG